MRIAFIDMMFNWPPSGGSWVDLFYTIKHLQKAGHEVKLFFPIYQKNFQRGRLESSLPFPYQGFECRKRDFFPQKLFERMKREVDSFKPDRVFIGDGYFIKVSAIEAFSKDYPTIVRIYGHEILCPNVIRRWRNKAICDKNFLDNPLTCLSCCVPRYAKITKDSNYHVDPFFYEGMITGAWRWFNFRRRAISALKGAKSIIVYNQRFADVYSRYNPDTRVISGGVDCDEFYPAKERQDNPFRIFLSARLVNPLKGFDFFKNAMELIKDKIPDWQIVYTDSEEAGSNYIPLGWIPYPRMPYIYRKSSMAAFVPVWDEPFGLVALEAMASGIPIVVSDVGVLKNIVRDGLDGYVVKPQDTLSLAEKVSILANDNRLAKAMGEKGRARAEEEYSWDKIVGKYYKEI
jgi:glycosyltransferase involved in cell wall biosynthesis